MVNDEPFCLKIADLGIRKVVMYCILQLAATAKQHELADTLVLTRIERRIDRACRVADEDKLFEMMVFLQKINGGAYVIDFLAHQLVFKLTIRHIGAAEVEVKHEITEPSQCFREAHSGRGRAMAGKAMKEDDGSIVPSWHVHRTAEGEMVFVFEFYWSLHWFTSLKDTSRRADSDELVMEQRDLDDTIVGK